MTADIVVIRHDTEIQRHRAGHEGLEQEISWGGKSSATGALGWACHGD